MYRLKRYNSNKEPLYSYATKFEIARGLGMRANKIAVDTKSPCLVYIKDETDVQRLAELELEENVLPIIIRRFSTDNKEFEDWIFDSDQDVYKDLLPTEEDNLKIFEQENSNKEFHYSFIDKKVCRK
jgi:DNA-directed RNA polymerase subunit K/omega